MSTTFRANALCRAMAFAIAAIAAAPLAAQTDAEVPTGRLPRSVEPSHRTLELRIDPETARMQGRAGMDVDVERPTERLWLHGRDLDIARAAIVVEGGERLPLKVEQVHVSGVLALTAPTEIPAGRARIEIEYAAPYGQLQGAYKVRPDSNDYVVTQMEPLGARNAFPGFDEPSFKTPWDISLVVPQDQVAVANTRQVAEEDAGGGFKRLRFARTEALPSYLIAFAVGPWDVVDAPDLPPNAVREVPLPLRGIAAEGRGGELDYALAHTGAIVDALETYFDIPYPFDKLDILAAPDFWAGAMENAGLIVYRDSLLLLDEDSGTRQKQAYWGVHAHELAHQWFGNLVTMPWWNDLWLNEAFATWMGNKIVGQLQPGFHTDRGLLEGAYGAMAADSLASTRRIGEPVHDFTDVSAAFDGITYQKGGAVLAMFERFIGEDAFRQGVRDYLRAHARGNATAQDLIAAVAARSDDPARVRAAFAGYIDQPGVPLLKAALDCDDPAAPALQVEQSRFLPLGSRAQGGQQWGIPVCVRTDGAGPTCQLVSEARARIALPGGRCPAFVMPNAGANGYYRFDLAADDRAALAANFDRLDPREQRAFADSLDAAYQTGTLDTAGFLAAAAPLAGAEARQTVTAPFARIEWILETLVDDPATAAPRSRGCSPPAMPPPRPTSRS
uniref:Aminopeptidase N n=1 Tax=Coralloluteibacterium stylophorae TaxID=1776034 RepID=A0A8J7VS16_9GAMM